MGYLTPLQRRGLALSGVAFSFCAFIIAQSSRFVKNFFLKSQFYFLGFRLHLLLSRSAPLRNDWWKNWETPHGIGLFRRNPLELLLCPYCITIWAICQGGFFTFFSRGSTRLLLRLSLQDTHFVVALLGLSPWHHYNTTPRSRLQDGIMHNFGRNNLCIFIALFSWQIAGSVV